jgi:hypothetical protein
MPIKHLNEALLATMRAGEQAAFGSRFRTLAPVVDQNCFRDQVRACAREAWCSVIRRLSMHLLRDTQG